MKKQKGFIQHHFGVGKSNKSGAGFTLIELLVVIAIIGILAAVLMVNLSGTRNKAKDSAIKLEMGQIRTAVESFALSQTSYTYVNACADGTTECDTLLDDITAKQGGTLQALKTFTTSAWCATVKLNTTTATYWCVDATGFAGPPTGTDCTAAVTCK